MPIVLELLVKLTANYCQIQYTAKAKIFQLARKRKLILNYRSKLKIRYTSIVFLSIMYKILHKKILSYFRSTPFYNTLYQCTQYNMSLEKYPQIIQSYKYLNQIRFLMLILQICWYIHQINLQLVPK